MMACSHGNHRRTSLRGGELAACPARGDGEGDMKDGQGLRSQWILRQGRTALFGILLIASSGCMRSWLNDWLDPSEVGRFEGKPITREIRTTLGLQDEEPDAIDASEPLPEDTVAIFEEYQIGPGDLLEITIHELVRAGSILTEARRVSNLGFISLPVIGRFKVGGMTEHQVEDYIKAALKPDVLPEPIVTVVVREERQRSFTIVGFTARAGSIPIPRPDFRMLEAISNAGTLPDEVSKIYVIRRSGKPTLEPQPPATTPAPETTEPASRNPSSPEEPGGFGNGKRRLWEDTDLLLNDIAPRGGGGMSATRPAGAATPPATSSKPARISEEQRLELLKAIVPGDATAPPKKAPNSVGTQAAAAATQPSVSEDPAKGMSKWIWLNGEWVEQRGTTREATGPREHAAEPQGPPATESAPVTKPSPPLEWEALAEATEQTRVIEIPRKPLEAGEARYNIVIRPGDVISIPSPEAGKRYYMTGHVRGPGAYMIPAEGITLKAAIAAAGGLDPFAWPSRCQLIRRIGADQEEVHQVDLDRMFAMKDDGLRIKAGDIINVGTHPLSPFLVSISNGFRMTYGFGFVYDRNFGTIDSYGAQQNPKDRRRQEQQSRFPALQAAFPGL